MAPKDHFLCLEYLDVKVAKLWWVRNPEESRLEIPTQCSVAVERTSVVACDRGCQQTDCIKTSQAPKSQGT
jgi:hypothetical protein